MGCISSKNSRRNSLELPEVEVDKTEKVIGLTKRQRFLLKGSWKGVNREMQATGVRLFIQMFETHPDAFQYFPHFQELGCPEEQKKSEVFQEHSEKVLSRIDEAVSSVENPDVLTAILLETGAFHKKIPGFNPDMFWYAEEPLMESVRVTLDERFTPQMDVIYNVITKYVIQTLIDGYNQAA